MPSGPNWEEFQGVLSRLDALEAADADHEDRLDALEAEPPPDPPDPPPTETILLEDFSTARADHCGRRTWAKTRIKAGPSTRGRLPRGTRSTTWMLALPPAPSTSTSSHAAAATRSRKATPSTTCGAAPGFPPPTGCGSGS